MKSMNKHSVGGLDRYLVLSAMAWRAAIIVMYSVAKCSVGRFYYHLSLTSNIRETGLILSNWSQSMF